MLFARKDGTMAFDFQGRLPTAWPATARHDGPTLFPFGYGLTYADGPQPWTALSQDSRVADDGSGGGVFFDKGLPTARTEEHTYELQSLMRISSAVSCLTTKQNTR